jgi:uncharacterized membrane protein
MGLDIKIPIGLMFTILGLLLIVYGLATMSNAAMYEPSLGININIWWGLLMLVFGVFMLLISRKPKETLPDESENQ